jgi:hypothetical protein
MLSKTVGGAMARIDARQPIGRMAPHLAPGSSVPAMWLEDVRSDQRVSLRCGGDGAFMQAYDTNRADAVNVALDADPVATAVRSLLTSPTLGGTWSGQSEWIHEHRVLAAR